MKFAGAVLFSALALAGCRDRGPGGDGGGTETDTDASGSNSDPTSDSMTESDSDTEGETESDTNDTGPMVDFEPPAGGMRKLLYREYRDTVEMILGAEAAEVADPPIDIGGEGFDAVGAWELAIGPVAVEDYEEIAGDVADAAVANKATLAATVPCVMNGDNACFETVARDFGRLAFRRTLEDIEVDQLVEIAMAGQEFGGNFNAGLRYELMAILQAPSFLYIQQVGEPDAGSGYRLLTGPELASRMAFFLTGKTPTLDLLDRAEAGELDSGASIRELANELITDSGSRTAIAAFFDEALRTRHLADAPKNAGVFPNFTPELAEFMRQETLLLVHDIVWERDADYRELFNASYTFVNDPLAELYGMPLPGTGNVFAQADWPAAQNRAGYTSQASFLTWQSTALRNSPTKRGKYVQQFILCNEIPPPDPTVDPTLPDSEDLSLKELLEMHMTEPACATCHALTDPIGFAYEAFNAIGEYRTTDNGHPVQTDGEVGNVGSWDNAVDLADILATDERTSACLIRNLLKGMLGQTPEAGQEPAIEELDTAFGDADYSVQSLMVEFVTHPLFRVVDEPK